MTGEYFNHPSLEETTVMVSKEPWRVITLTPRERGGPSVLWTSLVHRTERIVVLGEIDEHLNPSGAPEFPGGWADQWGVKWDAYAPLLRDRKLPGTATVTLRNRQYAVFLSKAWREMSVLIEVWGAQGAYSRLWCDSRKGRIINTDGRITSAQNDWVQLTLKQAIYAWNFAQAHPKYLDDGSRHIATWIGHRDKKLVMVAHDASEALLPPETEIV